MAFQRDERATHVSARDVRTSGTIVDVHDDAGTMYFTILLDDGREVQTVEKRLRKGEYTGIGKWQRVLDAQTGCYFFFDEDRGQTLWDTPEARDTIFGNSGSASSVLDTSVVSERAAFRLTSPSKNVSFSTEPPSVVYFSSPEQDRASRSPEDSADVVNLKPILPPRKAEQNRAVSIAPPIPTVPPGSAILASSESESRAKAISQSWELRKALASTGAAAIIGNLRVLGIPVNDEYVDEGKLPEMLASALGRISLTIEASDLNLLLRHVMGGPQHHSLADQLSYGIRKEESQESPLKFREPKSVKGAYDSYDSNPAEARAVQGEPTRTRNHVPPMRVALPGMAGPRSPNDSPRRSSREGSGAMEMKGEASPKIERYLPVHSSTSDSREYGYGDQMAINLGPALTDRSPGIDPYAPLQWRGNQEYQRPQVPNDSPTRRREGVVERNSGSLTDSRERDLSRQTEYAQGYERSPMRETAIVREGEELTVEKSPPRVLYESRNHDAFQDVPVHASTTRRPWSATLPPPNKMVASPDSVKRRADLWADMPPPSRQPPNGPPSYERYRSSKLQTSSTNSPSMRVRSEDLRSTSTRTTFVPDSRYLPTQSDTKPTGQSLEDDTSSRQGLSRSAGDDHLALPSTVSGQRLSEDARSLHSRNEALIDPMGSSSSRLPVREASSSSPTRSKARAPEIDFSRDDTPAVRALAERSPFRMRSLGELPLDDEGVEPPQPRLSRSALPVGAPENSSDSDEAPEVVYNADEEKDAGDEDDERRTQALRADLSDLNMSLDKLLEHVANAGERIDATWKPQQVEVKASGRDDEDGPTPIRMAPRPSAMCGPSACTIS